MKILFIDDEEYYNELFIEHIDLRTEWELKHVKTAKDALDFLEKHISEVDVIILDIMMPEDELLEPYNTGDGENSGLVFFEQYLKKIIKANDIPVVVYSNRADMDQFITKHTHDTNISYVRKSMFFTNILDKIKEVTNETVEL